MSRRSLFTLLSVMLGERRPPFELFRVDNTDSQAAVVARRAEHRLPTNRVINAFKTSSPLYSDFPPMAFLVAGQNAEVGFIEEVRCNGGDGCWGGGLYTLREIL